MKRNKMYIFALVLVLSLGVLGACSGADNNDEKVEDEKVENVEVEKEINPDDPILVGSFVDTEGGILGNMILLTLEENGYSLTDKVQFGTPDVHLSVKLDWGNNKK